MTHGSSKVTALNIEIRVHTMSINRATICPEQIGTVPASAVWSQLVGQKSQSGVQQRCAVPGGWLGRHLCCHVWARWADWSKHHPTPVCPPCSCTAAALPAQLPAYSNMLLCIPAGLRSGTFDWLARTALQNLGISWFAQDIWSPYV